jgi:hypothetical protein
MLLLIAAIVAVCWILGIGLFHVATSAFHLLLIVALIAVILYILGVGRRSVV